MKAECIFEMPSTEQIQSAKEQVKELFEYELAIVAGGSGDVVVC